MFYNHEKKFLFIHVQRTGGTSLLDHFYKTLSNDGQNYFQHTSLSYFQKKEQDAFAEAFRFAFVRNPWDRFASWYALLKGSGIAEQYGSFEEELYKATVDAHETPKMFRFPICQLELLKDIEYFRTVRVNPDIDTVVWDNDADLSPDFLYEIGVEHPAP